MEHQNSRFRSTSRMFLLPTLTTRAGLIWLFSFALSGVISHSLKIPSILQNPSMGQEKLPRIVPPIPKHIQFRSRTHVVEPSSIRNVTAQVGQTAYLHCIVGSLGDRTVSWIRLRDFHLLTVALYTYTSDDRFHPIHRQYSNDWMLQIKFSQPSDEGLYECQISADPSISHYVYLSIVVPKAKIPGASDLYVKAGSDINLTCIISQSPEPPSFVFWYHDNRMINYDSSKGDTTVQKASGDTAISRLTIRDAQPEDSGNYTCGPSNADATSILVHVLRGEKQAAVQNDAGSPPISAAMCSGSRHVVLFLISFILLSFWR
ncbi:zwei Ig domain protein zig-8-like [Centruroides vittatus]|uniref:zwei Ig domain protein zig-8-like n=1 Tax=Centruroides vittatus TaxID=120091 RepID=UPI003510CAC4